MFKIRLKFVAEGFRSIGDFLQNFYSCDMGDSPPISTAGIEVLNVQLDEPKIMVNIIYNIDDEELDFSNIVIDRINERYNIKTDVEFV